MDIRALSYLVFDTLDVDAWDRYATGVLGMMADPGPSGSRWIRMDERPYRLVVQSGAAEGLASLGWEVAGPKELQAAIGELRAVGLDVTERADLAVERRVAELACFVSPDGARHELFWGAEVDYLPFVSPAGVSRFVTGHLGLGHAVIAVPDLAEAQRFYFEVMGFRLSDTMTIDGVKVVFTHCNARHHSLALHEGPRSMLAHFMVEAGAIDDVGFALDRASDHGFKIRESFGRHTNDEMLSFYAATPSGFSVEFGFGGRLITDEGTWVPTETTRGSYWGHRRPSRGQVRA